MLRLLRPSAQVLCGILLWAFLLSLIYLFFDEWVSWILKRMGKSHLLLLSYGLQSVHDGLALPLLEEIPH